MQSSAGGAIFAHNTLLWTDAGFFEVRDGCLGGLIASRQMCIREAIRQ